MRLGLADPAVAVAGIQSVPPGPTDDEQYSAYIGLPLLPAVPVKASFAVVDPAASTAGKVEELSHIWYCGATDNACDQVILKTFVAFAVLFPALTTFDGILMVSSLF